MARSLKKGPFVDHHLMKKVETAGALAKTIDMKGGPMVLVEAGPFLAGEKKEPDTLPPLPSDVSKASKARNVPTEALTYYSRALLYQDRGDKAKATEYYNKALQVFPEYTEAKEGLKKVNPA